MRPTFIMLQAEAINNNFDAVCHIVAVHIVDGEIRQTQDFFLNPGDEPFVFVQSGITEEQVKSLRPYSTKWQEVEAAIAPYDTVVSTADGYSTHAICGTLARLGIPCKEKVLLNAKSICRKSLDEICYTYDYLAWKILGINSAPSADDPSGVATTWAKILLSAIEGANESSLIQFAESHNIKPGLFSSTDYEPSAIKKQQHEKKKFDSSGIEVEGSPDNPLYGLNVVFTGKLETLLRNEARALVVKAGGTAPDTLTTSTDLLVVGVQDIRVVGEKGLSGKMKKAEQFKAKGFNIEIIDEEDFLQMLGQ